MELKETTKEEKIKSLIKQCIKVKDDQIDIDGKWINIGPIDRGQRTDHGGGSDGDGWLSYEEVERLRKSYESKYKVQLEKLKSVFPKSNITLDYGEKGHISIIIEIKD